MELVCALLLLMLGTSAAAPQDLSSKMFTFPQETDTDHVSLRLKQRELGALSVCMRVFTDLRRPYALFLLNTNTSFVIRNHPDLSQYSFKYGSEQPIFNYNNYIMNAWQSVCGTWDAVSGLAQIWIDGKYSSRKFLSNSPITGNTMSVILGQSSDPALGKGHPRNRDSSFVGMLTDLHVWDYVLDPYGAQNYTLYRRFVHGNVLNWRQLEFEIHGRILLE
uniref:Pentraxin family member n=1 Tax=Neogobius melanostomus TaxID=47308 RepID=A0A8C6SBM3_9GOBI